MSHHNAASAPIVTVRLLPHSRLPSDQFPLDRSLSSSTTALQWTDGCAFSSCQYYCRYPIIGERSLALLSILYGRQECKTRYGTPTRRAQPPKGRSKTYYSGSTDKPG